MVPDTVFAASGYPAGLAFIHRSPWQVCDTGGGQKDHRAASRPPPLANLRIPVRDQLDWREARESVRVSATAPSPLDRAIAASPHGAMIGSAATVDPFLSSPLDWAGFRR